MTVWIIVGAYLTIAAVFMGIILGIEDHGEQPVIGTPMHVVILFSLIWPLYIPMGLGVWMARKAEAIEDEQPS